MRRPLWTSKPARGIFDQGASTCILVFTFQPNILSSYPAGCCEARATRRTFNAHSASVQNGQGVGQSFGHWLWARGSLRTSPEIIFEWLRDFQMKHLERQGASFFRKVEKQNDGKSGKSRKTTVTQKVWEEVMSAGFQRYCTRLENWKTEVLQNDLPHSSWFRMMSHQGYNSTSGMSRPARSVCVFG